MKAYLYMIGYGLSQTIVWILVSYLSSSIAVTVMFLFRNLVGFLISACLSSTQTVNRKTFYRWRTHLIRASATLFGGLSIFYSVTKIPVADSVAVTFLAPIFGSLLSVYFLGEKFTSSLVLKLFGGFIGVLVITGFSAEGDTWGYAASLFGAFMTGVAYVSVKSLSDTESPKDILFVSYFIMLPVATLLAIPDWQVFSIPQLIFLIAIGAAFYLSQTFMAKAFSLAPASKILPVDYLRIIFSSFLGVIFLNQEFTISTLCGAGIILLTSLLRDTHVRTIFGLRILN